MFSTVAASRPQHRVPRGRVAPARVPHARAPAVRAGARPGRRAHSRRLRRRPADGCAAISTRYLDESIEQFPRGRNREPEQTAAFRRVLQTAVLHVQSAQRQEAQVGDILRGHPSAAEDLRGGAARRAGHHAARRPRIHLARHHEDAASPSRPATRPGGAAGDGDEGPATARDPLSAYCVNLTDRARQGQLDPLIGRTDGTAAHHRSPVPPPQEQSGLRRRCRRRQDGDGRRAGHAAAGRRCPGGAEGRRGVRARHRRAAGRHALPRRFRGALQGRHQRRSASGRRRSSSSTKSTRRSAPARSPAARWIWRRC